MDDVAEMEGFVLKIVIHISIKIFFVDLQL